MLYDRRGGIMFQFRLLIDLEVQLGHYLSIRTGFVSLKSIL